MSLREALLIALRGLRAHRLRSGLTMIGLIIGVAAVILLVACGQGVQNSVNTRIEPVANLVTIVPQSASVPGGPPAQSLTDADAAALSNAPDVATVTPAVTSTASIGTDTTTFLSGSIIGTTNIWSEAIVLAGLGGLVGVGAGIGLSLLAGVVAPTLDPASGVFSGFTPVLSILPVAVFFGISLMIGLIAGSYPAYRAAQLRPIQALRYS